MEMYKIRILVCGGRDFTDWGLLQDWMDHAVPPATAKRDVLIIHGGARGADRMACELERRAGVAVWGFPADWVLNGKRAGPIRNQQMLDEGKPTIVVAMPGGTGTADMVRRARKAGVPVIGPEVGEKA